MDSRCVVFNRFNSARAVAKFEVQFEVVDDGAVFTRTCKDFWGKRGGENTQYLSESEQRYTDSSAGNGTLRAAREKSGQQAEPDGVVIIVRSS
jgi:hypothetical protein